MWSIAILVVAFSVNLAAQTGTPDYGGVWVARSRAQSDRGDPQAEGVIIRRVSRDARQWNVAQTRSGSAGMAVSVRQCVPMSERRYRGKRGDAVRRTSVLACGERREQWTISGDGSELIVQPLAGKRHTSETGSLVFRRSERLPD
jgi:hypothetical protein